MNYFSKTILAGLMLVSTSIFAAEPAEGWYAGFMLGAAFAQPSTSSITVTTINPPSLTNPSTNLAGRTITRRLSHKVGLNLGGQIGYRCSKFRYEGELNYSFLPYGKIGITDQGLISTDRVQESLILKGNRTIGAAFFNAYYEFYDEENSETKWVPYLGLGIGYAHISNALKLNYSHILLPARTTDINWTDRNSLNTNAPVAQGILGINYFFSDTMSLGADLRYMSTKTIRKFNSMVTTGTFNLVMNFSFDQPDYAI